MRQIGPHTHAYLQPDGGWGWSNAGLVVGDDGCILVDTFFDLDHTRALLDAVNSVTDAPIRTLVNTHHNGDHVFGNQLVEGAVIVGHRNCRTQLLAAAPPAMLHGIVTGEPGEGGVGYLQRAFAPFDFSEVEVTPPQITFGSELTVHAGDVAVELRYFGPAHTLGDIVAWVPADRVLFCGDLLFYGSTPLVWEGSLGNWINAIDALLALEAETVVPGHGPVTTTDGLRAMQAYLQRVVSEGAKLKERGLSPQDAAREIDLGAYVEWADPERIVLNLMRLWLELDGEPAETPIDPFDAFGAMAELAAEWPDGRPPA